MLPVILAAVGGYLVYDSLKSKKFADGGTADEIMDSDGQTDKELYDALKDMGYNFGKYGTSKFDEDGFSEMAVNLGYRWDEKKKVWHNKNMMADGGMTKTKPTSDAEMKETMRQLLTRNKNSHSRAKGRIELYSDGSFKDWNSFFTEYEKRFGKQDADIVKKAKANYDSAVLVKMADGGNLSEAIYLEGTGWVMPKTINKLNEDGVSEPTMVYEPIESMNKKNYADGGKVLVGKFDEKQLRNGEDKKAIDKKMKETGLKYIDSKIIKKNGKPHMMEVYLYADGGMMAKGGMVVTSIKDIPNFKQRLKDRKITYRGLGMGKKSDDFYDIAGEHGVSIKVDGKEYHITETEFDTFSRGADGKLIVRFDAPYRKSYADGGMMAKGGNVRSLSSGIRKYYVEAYPEDDMGADINPKATFKGLLKTLEDKKNVYTYLDVSDSLVRERVFGELSEIMGVKYSKIYNMWLLGDDD